ncbi:hypothetical protein HY411_00770 [Candidatus Gottesmanbacteria bacterium]|nr:hypothetical protein [Candidatus Gottesmanbacteria bacterium]
MTEQWESGRQGSKAETLGHRVVGRVTDGVLTWWEGVGPKRVEDQWVAAHQRVLDAIPDEDQRKEVFRLSAERWRKIGGRIGVAATAIDFSLAGVGLWLSAKSLKTPPVEITSSLTGTLSDSADSADKFILRLRQIFNKEAFQTSPLWTIQYHIANALFWDEKTYVPRRGRMALAGRLFSFIPGMGAVGIAAGAGPAHAVGALAARAAEGMGKRALKQKRKS